MPSGRDWWYFVAPMEQSTSWTATAGTWVVTCHRGTVKGNEIACPFHDWRWGGDGRCKNVPYSRRVPRLARTATWPTLEQDGMLFVWNDPERKAPPADVSIPRIEGATSDGWTDWHWYTTVVNTNCREIIDNVVDMAHFFYIHGSLPTHFKNIFEGHVATQYMKSGARPDIGDPEGVKLLGTDVVGVLPRTIVHDR